MTMDTPNRGATEPGGRQEYRYQWPGVWMVFSLVVMGAIALGVPWHRALWAVLGVALMLLWGAYVVIAIQTKRLAAKGRVLLDDDGVTVRDGRGHEDRLTWSGIDGLFVPRKLSGNRTPWVPIEVRGSERRLEIGGWVEHADSLIETITARAGLTETKREGPGTLYTRPTE